MSEEENPMETCIADMTSILSNTDKCQLYFHDMKCSADGSCDAGKSLAAAFCDKQDEDTLKHHAHHLCARSSEVVGVSMYEMNVKLKESHGGYWDTLIYDESGKGSEVVGVGGVKSHVNQTQVRPDTDMLGRENNGVVFLTKSAGSF